jgi:hypothetical protein
MDMIVKIIIGVIIALVVGLLISGIVARGPKKKYDAVGK